MVSPSRHLAKSMIAAAVVLAMTVPVVADSPSRASEITIDKNNARTGWDANEPKLSPSVVHSSSFGQLFATTVAGQVYAQPIVVGSAVIVATEENNVYSLNAQTGAINWQLNLGPAWPSSATGCIDIAPNIGVTSTPVYDASTGTVYLAAVLNNGQSLNEPNVDFFAINALTGQENWQVQMRGAPANDPTRPFDPFTERQRASLLLLGGEVYVSFASYCDNKPYVGLVAAVNTTTHALTMWSDEAGPPNDLGGIWMSGAGAMSDGAGRVFVTSGNGTTPPFGLGTHPPSALANSVIRLGLQPDGTLTALDFFAPSNAPQLNTGDRDLGSSGPVALPFGTSTFPHLLVEGSKDGRVFILNRDNLGGRRQTDHAVSVNGPYSKEFGHPAAFAGSGGNDFIYYLGVGDLLRAFKFNTSTAVLTDAFDSAARFGYGSGSPVVTSNGTDPASAIVWVVSRGSTGSTLDAFAAVPSAGSTLPLLWSGPIGTAAKFSVPATDSGRVYVGTADGKVYGFGS